MQPGLVSRRYKPIIVWVCPCCRMLRPQQEAQQQPASCLLALPEQLLVAVLQCLAAPADQRSLFSAARAHSRLHQAAVQLVGSIAVAGIQQQQTVDSLLLYLSRHAHHVRTLSLAGAADTVSLYDLPPALQLHSLELTNLRVQLLPGSGCKGVLGPAAGASALQQLRLKRCTLLDDTERLAAALERLLPRLQHLSIEGVSFDTGMYQSVWVCTEALSSSPSVPCSNACSS